MGTRRGAHMAIREAELRATSSQPASWPELTIIVPTRNEAGNVEALLGRVQEAVAGRRTEVIFVDDSTDDTPQVISSLAGQFAMPVSLIHRPAGQRGDGLGGAVAAGMRAATGQWLCVMDADLQHPPSVIPQLLARARDSEADLVLASRFVTSGRTDGLTPARLITSQGFRRASQVLFPGRLASVT